VAETAHRHPRPDRGAQRRALVVSLAVNATYLVVEIIGGLAFHSLALIADAAHMATDVIALTIAMIAQVLVDRPATARHSFGLKRSEVVLIGVSVLIIVEAISRIGSPSDVIGPGVVAVASIGLVINLISAVLLLRAEGQSLNMHGAFLHMAADAAGSVAAIAAGVAAWVWHADWVDPIASIAIAVLVAASAWGLLRDTTNVLLEGSPRGIDPDAVRNALADDPSVEAVHHVHLWSLASDEPSLSAHVVLSGEVTLHEAQQHGAALKAMLADRFDIDHSTLELECHPCDEPAPAGHPLTGGAGAKRGVG
jgi:cobalt-zinc-cadmium efflux system protein